MARSTRTGFPRPMSRTAILPAADRSAYSTISCRLPRRATTTRKVSPPTVVAAARLPPRRLATRRPLSSSKMVLAVGHPNRRSVCSLTLRMSSDAERGANSEKDRRANSTAVSLRRPRLRPLAMFQPPIGSVSQHHVSQTLFGDEAGCASSTARDDTTECEQVALPVEECKPLPRPLSAGNVQPPTEARAGIELRNPVGSDSHRSVTGRMRMPC